MSGPTFYAYGGKASSELLSYKGRVLIHTDPQEMEFLVPGFRIVKLSATDLAQRVMLLRDHPNMAAVKWPIQKEAFR